MTYLDYNATAPIRPEAATAVAEALAAGGNPSSVHRFGRDARRRVEEARARVAALVGARPAEVVFLSGGTEANNLALKGCGAHRLVVSAVEHDSVLAAAEASGAELAVLPVDALGVADLAALPELLETTAGPTLLSLMLANNETGVIQPVAEAARLAHAAGAVVHCDAVQAPGRISLDMAALGVDLLSLSAHKLGGPAGVGALIVRQGLDLRPLAHGGGQELGRRAGTENLAGIAGFGVAAELAAADLEHVAAIAALRDEAERRIAAIAPAATIHGQGAPRLPNTSAIAMPGVASETQVIALDLAGVAVSAGSACSSGKVKASHVLRAMGLGESEAGSAIRVSLGWRSTADDVERLVAAWQAVYMRLADKRKGSATAA